MCAGPKFEYKWADGVRIKKPVRCSAPKYVDYMMTWVQATLDDEAIFPVRVGEPFRCEYDAAGYRALQEAVMMYRPFMAASLTGVT